MDTQQIIKVPAETGKSEAGDSDRITRAYLDSLLIEYRHIGATEPATEFHLFGRTFASPVMVGGMAAVVPHLHEGGMAEFARGAKEAGAVMWTGYISDREFAEVLETGASAIRIIKPMQDRKRLLEAIKHDEEHGALAFAVDIDHGFGDDGSFAKGTDAFYSDLEPQSAESLRELVSSTKLPFIAKGILGVRDAKICLEAGAAALLVSHHKGEMRFAVPPVMAAQKIRARISAQVPVFVDCGITSGMDAYKAMALGASGVCAARAFLKPFVDDGADGVRNKLCEMTKELKGIMARTCVPDLAHMDPEAICCRSF